LKQLFIDMQTTDSQLPSQLIPYVLRYCSLRQINHKYMKEKQAEFQLMKTQIIWYIMPSRWIHGLCQSPEVDEARSSETTLTRRHDIKYLKI